jgi:phosphoheptose isomerase
MNYVKNLVETYPVLADCEKDVQAAVDAIVKMYYDGGKILLCGNGGSAADSSHIAGELLKGFILKREPKGENRAKLESVPEIAPYAGVLQDGFCAIALPDQSAVLSAFANDCAPEAVFAQLVYSMHKKGDVVLGMSTSGNSKNVVLAIATAKAMGLFTIGLTGAKGGKLRDLCDVTICVPETETYKVQELHLPVYHAICAEVERILFE